MPKEKESYTVESISDWDTVTSGAAYFSPCVVYGSVDVNDFSLVFITRLKQDRFLVPHDFDTGFDARIIMADLIDNSVHFTDFTGLVELRGEITTLNQEKHTATLRTGGGDLVRLEFVDDVDGILEDSFIHYSPSLFRENHLVLVRGEMFCGVGDLMKVRADRIERLHPLDPVYRMEQIMGFQKEEDAEFKLSKEGMDWLREFFRHYPSKLLPPYMCAWEGNTVHLEWDQEGSALVVDLDVSLDSHVASGVVYRRGEARIREVSFDLNNGEDVERLYGEIRGYREV